MKIRAIQYVMMFVMLSIFVVLYYIVVTKDSSLVPRILLLTLTGISALWNVGLAIAVAKNPSNFAFEMISTKAGFIVFKSEIRKTDTRAKLIWRRKYGDAILSVCAFIIAILISIHIDVFIAILTTS